MSEQISERSQTFTTSRNLLLSGADAVERIMTSFKEVSKVIWTSFYKHTTTYITTLQKNQKNLIFMQTLKPNHKAFFYLCINLLSVE